MSANMEDMLRVRKPGDDFRKDTLLTGQQSKPFNKKYTKSWSLKDHQRAPLVRPEKGRRYRVTEEIARGVLTTPGTLTTLSEKFGISRAAVHQIVWGFGTTGRRFKKLREEILDARRRNSGADAGGAEAGRTAQETDGQAGAEVLDKG